MIDTMPESTKKFIDDRDGNIMQEYPYMFRGLWDRYLLLQPHTLDDHIAWCRDNIGDGQFTYMSIKFFFKRKEDMVLFALRWA